MIDLCWSALSGQNPASTTQVPAALGGPYSSYEGHPRSPCGRGLASVDHLAAIRSGVPLVRAADRCRRLCQSDGQLGHAPQRGLGWITAARIGHSVLAAASVLALAIGLSFPSWRRAAATTAW